MMKPLKLLSPLLFVLLTLELVGCSKPPEVRTPQPPVVEGDVIRFPTDSQQVSVLKTEKVEAQRTETLRLPGRLAWDETRTVRVFAPVAGQITRLMVEPGQPVQQGAPLALLSSPDLGQAQTEARRASADTSLAEKNVARLTELHEHGIIALKDLQSAQAELERANAERSRAAVRLKLYGAGDKVDQEFALRASMSGIVVERNANPGQEVRPDQAQPGAPALFVVSDPTHLWAQLDAPESAAGSLKVGSKITLRTPAAPDGKVEGRIEQIADFIDPQSRTVKIRIAVDNRSRVLKADSFVSAEAEVDRGNFIAVPATAVFLNGETQYVFIDEGERRYRRAAVKAEEAGFGKMRVRSGVEPGQSVVTEGGLLLQQVFASATSKPQADPK